MRRWKPLLVPCFVAVIALAHAASAAGPSLGIGPSALALPEPSTLLLVSLELAGLAVGPRRGNDRGIR